MRRELDNKYRKLKETLAEAGGLVIAYSGGVDSTLLLKAAVEALGDRALAVTVASEIHAPEEVVEAEQQARELGARHRTLEVSALGNEDLARNAPDRCYHCKLELFQRLQEIAEEEGLAGAAEGSNVDDLRDYRPGMRALRELEVLSPLREVGLGKAEIRELSRELGLGTWDRPSLACLASRIPYGERLTTERLGRVAAAERFLRGLGLRQVRVRDYGQTARIEVDTGELEWPIRAENRTRIVEELHKIGYLYVTLDLEGYRSGSLNVVLGAQEASEQDS